MRFDRAEVDDNDVVDWIAATGIDDYGPAWHELNHAEQDYRRASYLIQRDFFLGES